MSGFYTPGVHAIHEKSEKQSSTLQVYSILFFGVLGLAYVVATLYFLFHGDFSAMQASCKGMWEMLLIRIISSVLVSLVILIYFFQDFSVLNFLSGNSGVWVFFAYFLLFCLTQIYFYANSLVDDSTGSCVSVIQRESSHVLIIISWFSFALDTVFVLLYTYKLISLYFFRHDM